MTAQEILDSIGFEYQDGDADMELSNVLAHLRHKENPSRGFEE